MESQTLPSLNASEILQGLTDRLLQLPGARRLGYVDAIRVPNPLSARTHQLGFNDTFVQYDELVVVTGADNLQTAICPVCVFGHGRTLNNYGVVAGPGHFAAIPLGLQQGVTDRPLSGYVARSLLGIADTPVLLTYGGGGTIRVATAHVWSGRIYKRLSPLLQSHELGSADDIARYARETPAAIVELLRTFVDAGRT